ncbi:conserved hypothetical protein [Aeromonas veronii]|uniref:Transposase n=1 Tax=Aeromonas veronii TaxID=654 RepID=A0A653KYF9_AERVE|nr:conserved hypothetical protein [Aeromonas veronii]
MAAWAAENGVKVDAGQRVAKGVDALQLCFSRQRQPGGELGHALSG